MPNSSCLKPLQLLKSILQSVDEDLVIEYNETNAEFSFENLRMTLSKCLKKKKIYKYEAVIPKENPNIMQIDRGEFLIQLEELVYFPTRPLTK